MANGEINPSPLPAGQSTVSRLEIASAVLLDLSDRLHSANLNVEERECSRLATELGCIKARPLSDPTRQKDLHAALAHAMDFQREKRAQLVKLKK